MDSENLTTLVVVVPGQGEQDFLKTYESLGENIAAYGGPDWGSSFNPANLGKDDGNFGPEGNRSRVVGSPVVPGSATKVFSEGDVHLYSITILRGHYEAGYYEGDDFVAGKFTSYVEPFKAAARERRLPVREWSFDPSLAGGLEGQVEQARWEVQQTLTTIVRWCRAHYGEVFSGWIHLKVVRAFVESVLRYGLPVDFLPVFLEPNMKREKAIMKSLSNTIGRMRSDLAVEDTDEGDAQQGVDETDLLPYVCQKFNIFG